MKGIQAEMDTSQAQSMGQEDNKAMPVSNHLHPVGLLLSFHGLSVQTAQVYSVQTHIARRHVFGLKAAMKWSHKSIMDLAIHDDRSLHII